MGLYVQCIIHYNTYNFNHIFTKEIITIPEVPKQIEVKTIIVFRAKTYISLTKIHYYLVVRVEIVKYLISYHKFNFVKKTIIVRIHT